MLSVICGLLVGLVLAVIGGGGSILATPLMLYVVGVPSAHAAIGTSALAVSANAFLNLIPHAKAGHVKWPCATLFATAGIVGAAAGAALGKMTDAAILLPLFAFVMLLVAAAMLKPATADGDASIHLTWPLAPRIVIAGILVGGMSGFFGIGGGFLVVPGLLASTGMTMLNAIGSSLVSVGAFGATTAASYAVDGLIDLRVATGFIGGGIIGGVLGTAVAARLARHRGLLQKLFAVVLVLVALTMLWREWPWRE